MPQAKVSKALAADPSPALGCDEPRATAANSSTCTQSSAGTVEQCRPVRADQPQRMRDGVGEAIRSAGVRWTIAGTFVLVDI
jgi:hypothetical protein